MNKVVSIIEVPTISIVHVTHHLFRIVHLIPRNLTLLLRYKRLSMFPHHPIIIILNFTNNLVPSGFVKMSATWFLVSIFHMDISLFTTASRK
jgi:hypothetical protein